MKRKRAGFTLIELLVTLGIIMLLAALLFSAFARAREQGKKSTCASNLHQIGIAILQYVQDNGGKFLEGDMNETERYITNTQIFACPSDFGYGSYYSRSGARPFYVGGSSYQVNDSNSMVNLQGKQIAKSLGLDGVNEAQVASPSRVVLECERCAFEGYSWHDGLMPRPGHRSYQNSQSNVCFVDGHVKYIKIYYDLDPDSHCPATNCYNPPGTQNGTSSYEYQWSATP